MRKGYPPFGVRMLNIITEVMNRTMGMRMTRGWQVGGRACLLGEASLLGILLVRDLRNVMRETLLVGDVMHDPDMAGNTHESLLGGDQGVLLKSINSYLVVGTVSSHMKTMRDFAEQMETKLGHQPSTHSVEIISEVEGKLDLQSMVTTDELFQDFARHKVLSYKNTP